MKSILYVAATLMIGASIYGFVDYSKTKKRTEFKSMYHENEIKAPAVEKEEGKPLITQPEAVSKKEIIEVKSDQPAKPVVKKKKQKRSVAIESFSRAPLREKENVVILDPSESKDKEQ